MSNAAVRDWAAVLAGIAALGVVVYGFTAQYGWFQTIVLWPLHVFGLVMSGVAVAKGAPKLLLLITPIFLIPLGMGAMLLYACSQGDCL